VEITGYQTVERIRASCHGMMNPKFGKPVLKEPAERMQVHFQRRKRLQNKLKRITSLSYPYLGKPGNDREDLEFREKQIKFP